MNKKFLCLALASLAFASCEKFDKHDIYVPAEYSDILNFREVGEQDITLYNGIGEDGVYSFTVMKGGIHPEQESKATLRVMTEEELKEYTDLVQREYKLLPAEYYSIDKTDIVIPANSQYVKGNVSLKSDGIKTLAEGYKDGRYVLPLVLESKTDSVNAERRRVILRPTVLTPTIAFPSQWQPSVVVARTENEKEFRFTLELPFNSPWDFTVKVAWDEKRFDGWNTLGEANYSIPNGGVVQFRKGSNRSEEVVVKLKNSPELLGGRHVLPLKITDISKSGILPQDGRHQYWILPSYNKFPLVASMLSTNAQQPDEGPIANLVDGNTQSYFHTKWAGGNGGVTAPHYFEVRFNEPITTCRFRHTTRHNNNNGAPQIAEIRVSSDGNSWTTLKRIENGMPSAAHQEYVSEVMKSATPFTHLRYVVMKTTTGDAPRFFALGEFEFFTK